MTKKIKLLILLISALCIFSLCAIPVWADEPAASAPLTFYVVKAPYAKTEYTSGEYFDPNGFLGYALYDDGTTSLLPSDMITYREKDPLTSSVTSITFEYMGKLYPVSITVSDPYIPAIDVTDITLNITKTEFLELETVTPALLELKVLCSDGSAIVLEPSQCSFTPELNTPLNAGTTSILATYSYGGKEFSATANITVLPILSLGISGPENPHLYEWRPITLPEGVTVTAYYDEAKTVSRAITAYDISADTEYVKADANDKIALTITAGSVSHEFECYVLPIVNYKINGLKDVYYYGDTLDISAVTVQAVYSDLTTVDVTNQVIFSNPPSLIVKGSKLVASHNGFDLKDFIKTEFPEGTLDIITAPNKLQYEIGESFDSTGLTVGINYSNGERRFLNPGDYTLKVSSPLTAADKFATLEYFGVSSNISFTVGNEAHIVSLNIIGMPNTMDYFEGSLISTSGLIIEAHLSDGTKTIIDPHMLTFTPSLQTPLEVGTTVITISANDGTDKYCSTTLPITVQEKLPTGLIAPSKPAKLVYNEGEIFNPDGLTLSLVFNDLTSITPSSFSFRPELGTPIILEKSAESKLIIYAVYEYEGQEFTYPIEITVLPAEVEKLLVSRNPLKTEYEIGETFDPAGLELLVIYKETTLIPHVVPEGYYTISPEVITETTTEIVFEFRGLTATLPITVKGIETDPPITDEITTGPNNTDTTSAPITDITTDPNTTTDNITEPPITTEDDTTTEDPPVTPGSSDITTSPDDPGTSDSTTEPGDKDNTSSLLGLWIIIIAIIIAMLIALIIYYKRNFT